MVFSCHSLSKETTSYSWPVKGQSSLALYSFPLIGSDGNIRYYEYENDSLHFLTEYKSSDPRTLASLSYDKRLTDSQNEVLPFSRDELSTLHRTRLRVDSSLPVDRSSLSVLLFPVNPRASSQSKLALFL